MTYIKEYWDDQKKRAELAKQHTEEMEKQHRVRIGVSAEETKIYTGGKKFKPDLTDRQGSTPKVIVADADSVSAIFTYADGKTAVLNFASYKNPGGMFLQGSRAQEECLCHSSFLYNVLSRQKEYYEWNRQHKNRGLYLDRALYSPDILFFKDEKETFCDVITCAAPNISTARKYCMVSNDENHNVLYERIKFVLQVAEDQKVDTMIFGAFGCGVFGQNPAEVAAIFKELLSKGSSISKIIFAIPDGRNGNLAAFRKTFPFDDNRPRAAVTGHRPNKLWGYDMSDPRYATMKKIFKERLIEMNAKEGISGMALGVDMVFALAVLELKAEGYDIKLVCAIPCQNHPCRWPEESQKLYQNILSQADEVVLVTDAPYAPRLMQVRNEYMVDRLSGPNDKLIAVWDGSNGGTGNCVKYAMAKECNITCITPKMIEDSTY